jgi:hypothetical protein
MSHTPAGLQKQLDVLQVFCCECQLTVNVKKTKVVVFEARKSVCQAFQYKGETTKQLNSFKYPGVELHGTKGMQATIQRLAMLHYNKKGAYCDPKIITNNKEISFRKPAVLNNNSSQTFKPLRNPHLRTHTIASSSQLPKLKQSQNISDYNVFYT